MGMSAGRSGELNSEINVTPLVDVMLVLLIIFMVTAPMLQSGVDLDLPQGQVETLGDDPEGTLTLSIDRNGQVFLGETQVAWNVLEEKLKTSAKVQADRELRIEADRSLRYDVVIRAMTIARNAGVAKLMMVTEPVDLEELPPVVTASEATGTAASTAAATTGKP